ncbi:MAG: ABC transporter substrate-binding protein [Peptostreptococcaceae bacterium]
MFKKVLSLLTVSALFLTGCTSTTSSTDLEEITIAEVAHSVFYAPQYVAITNGYFEEEGLLVDIITTSGADKTMAALLSDEAQIGLMGPEASIYVYNQGSENYAVNFAQLTQTDGSFLMAREEMPDFSFEDLKGTEILGGREGGVPLMTFEYLLKQNGLVIGENTSEGEVNVRSDVHRYVPLLH